MMEAGTQEPFDSDIDELGDRIQSTLRRREEMGVSRVVLDLTQFKRFKNVINFVTDPEGLGMGTLWEYTRQYQYLRDFYGLMCPRCNEPGPDPLSPYDCWGKDPQQLQDDVLFEIDETTGFYVCPQCHNRQDDIARPSYNELIAVVGMRSGKTVLAAMILLWELHQDLLRENPQREWGLTPGQEIYYTCATTKTEQAKDTIYAALDGMFENSQWFTRYNAALKQLAADLHVPLDKVFVKNTGEIRYLHKQLFVDNTGANSAGIAGKTRKVVVIDEIARFMQSESRLGVDLVYDTLKNSLLTLAKFGSKMVCISSPIIKTDKIMRLYEEAEKRKSATTLYFRHSTWDFNPNLPFDHPFIQERMEQDPVACKRDYGADPPGAQDPWMPEEWRIDDCVDGEIPSLVHARTVNSALIVKGKRTDMVGKELLHKDMTSTKHIVVACDPGYRRDSFGMVLAYLKPIRTVRGIEEHMFVGWSDAWVPTQKPRREVDFANVLRVIHEMSNWWILDKVVYDQWNSPMQIQDLQKAGIDAEKIPLKKEDWDNLASLFYNKQIHLLHPKIGGKGAERLIWELKNLEIKENGKVDHSNLTSSDIAVCLARAAKTLLGPEQTQIRVAEARANSIGQTVRFRRP